MTQSMAPCFLVLFVFFLAGEHSKSMGNDNAAQSTLYLERASVQAHTGHAQGYCSTLTGPLDGIFCLAWTIQDQQHVCLH